MSLLISTTKTVTSLQPTTTTFSNARTYKGKCLRSWADLPLEILRLIATKYLIITTQNAPQYWAQHDQWPSRTVFQLLRDATIVEQLMLVCTQWGAGLETHPFWRYACATFDPHHALAQHAVIYQKPAPGSSAASSVVHLSPYQHFRNMSQISCGVCRVNSPFANVGLGLAKRTMIVESVARIGLCRTHKPSNTFCGLCLRTEMQGGEVFAAALADNEDTQTWPGVEATCRYCRAAALWTRVRDDEADRAAVGATGGHSWDAPDWEVRQAVDAYITLGEGAALEVVVLAREKAWLRTHTRLQEMLANAVAAARLQARAEAGEVEEDTYSDDSYDSEVLALSDDADSCKELALNDWVRSRILDGHWFSPADSYYSNTMPGHCNWVKADHPAPWLLDHSLSEEQVHPRKSYIEEDVPPTFLLCEQAYRAYSQQMKIVLLPAMANIVRRLAIECTADGVDPVLAVSRLGMEDICQQLRQGAIWHNGVDWLPKRSRDHMEVDRDKFDDDASSEGTDATSPVLSTSTFQTTPSPEPIKEEMLSAAELAAPIPVHPVLDSPVPLSTIPCVPETFAHLPQYSVSIIQQAWREACAPLYQCCCGICARGAAKAQGVQSPNTHVPVVPDAPVTTVKPAYESNAQVGLPPQSGEGEVVEITRTAHPQRKRSREVEIISEPDPDAFERSSTPPKRLRVEGRNSPVVYDTREQVRLAETGSFKRQKVDDTEESVDFETTAAPA